MGARLKKDEPKCSGELCAIKEACWRFTVKPKERQMYFFESPVDPGAYSCFFFLPNGKPIPKEIDMVKKLERKRSIYG